MSEIHSVAMFVQLRFFCDCIQLVLGTVALTQHYGAREPLFKFVPYLPASKPPGTQLRAMGVTLKDGS